MNSQTETTDISQRNEGRGGRSSAIRRRGVSWEDVQPTSRQYHDVTEWSGRTDGHTLALMSKHSDPRYGRY